jgi:hypothetical protein
MKGLTLTILTALVTATALGSVVVRSGHARPASCRKEGSLIGHQLGLRISPCHEAVPQYLHRNDQMTTAGQVTFKTHHVKRCTLETAGSRHGLARIRPRRFVVLRLEHGSIFCKADPGFPRWKFRARNAVVGPVYSLPRRRAERRTDGDGPIFGLVAVKKRTVVKVADGSVRVSAAGRTRLVRSGKKVTVRGRHEPGPAVDFTPTAREELTIVALENDVDRTGATDLARILRGQNRGVVVSEESDVAKQVAQQVPKVKLVTILRDRFLRDPTAAARLIRKLKARTVVVTGTFAPMESILEQLRNPDLEGITGKLAIVFVPLRPATTMISFEDLATGKTPISVSDRYESLGVQLNNPAVVNFSFTQPSLPHSGTNAIRQCNSPGQEFCDPLFEFDFAKLHKRVGVWVGFDRSLFAKTTVILRALSRNGQQITKVVKAFDPTDGSVPIRTPLEIRRPMRTIASAQVSISPANTGLILDDLEYDHR